MSIHMMCSRILLQLRPLVSPAWQAAMSSEKASASGLRCLRKRKSAASQEPRAEASSAARASGSPALAACESWEV